MLVKIFSGAVNGIEATTKGVKLNDLESFSSTYKFSGTI